jgi:hypothetical protein
MLFTSLFVAAATFSTFASAQNETSNPLPPGIQPCCTVDPNVIPDSLKTGWCQAQRNTCPEICGGIPELSRGGQTCDQVRDTDANFFFQPPRLTAYCTGNARVLVRMPQRHQAGYGPVPAVRPRSDVPLLV